jgi:hypothetical protein
MFATSKALIAGKGLEIPSGGYVFSIAGGGDKWSLIIARIVGDSNGSQEFATKELVRLPMSVKSADSSSKNLVVSFDHMDSSCTMQVRWADKQASVEFVAKKLERPGVP